VRRWVAGAYPIPVEVGEWLMRLADAHRKNPPPEL
jgi:hypothetical protein